MRFLRAKNRDDTNAMDIREEDVAKYQDLVKSHLGKEIDRAKAREELTKLVRMMAVITRPIPKGDEKNVFKQ